MTLVETHISNFESAHKRNYPIALAEIKQGRKQSHWMWYIFHKYMDWESLR